jgi:hypothetical protein
MNCGPVLERGVSKMTIIKFLRKFLKKHDPKPTLAYVQESRDRTSPVGLDPAQPADPWEMENEIDLSARTDLEDYARGLSVSKKSIERWISSGLLMPEELKVAEKLVKIMSKN